MDGPLWSPGGGKKDVSSMDAVLLGALAHGVNGPTWNSMKVTFFMLVLCLLSMLAFAFSSSDTALILHVAFLVIIAGGLFLLLSRFVAETGLVGIGDQMIELGFLSTDRV